MDGTQRRASPVWEPGSPPRVAVIAGSVDAGSPVARLAALAAKELHRADAEVSLVSLADYPMPLHDGELGDRRSPPETALKLRQMLAAHRGIFIAAAEHNASIGPTLKNAIDWLSPGRAGGAPPIAVFRDRVFALGAVSYGGDGGVRALVTLRQVLELGCGALVLPEQIAVRLGAEAFDEMDELRDETLAAELRMLAHRLVDTARRLG
jgi:chromate reductase, NAD(P)H dehydrogenase (quinone)